MKEILPGRERLGEFESSVYHGINEALSHIRRNFELNPDRRLNLPYHDTLHTRKVIQRTSLILNTIRKLDPSLVTQRDINIGKLAASFHDIIQDWDEVCLEQNGFAVLKRKRHVGDNELLSAEKAISFAEKINNRFKNNVFTDKDKLLIREAVNVTVPGFDMNLNTVIQPYLTKESSLIACSVALSDLGSAGLDDPEAFLKESDALFREENLDILCVVSDKYLLSKEITAFYKERMLSWTDFQKKFIEGRKILLPQELSGIPLNVGRSVAKLFNRFDDSIDAVKVIQSERNKMSFNELICSFGYTSTKN